MGKVYDRIDDRLRAFIAEQPLFFVATAPRAGGHVNLSPKGYQDTFAVIDDHTVGYLDMYGSGAETVAHLRENGRITVMFCSFGRTPKILRLYGTGRWVTRESPEWAALAPRFPADNPSKRSIIVVDVTRIADSCGFGVPYLEPAGERDQLKAWGARKSPEELEAYRLQKNTASIDGLPAFDPPVTSPGAESRDR